MWKRKFLCKLYAPVKILISCGSSLSAKRAIVARDRDGSYGKLLNVVRFTKREYCQLILVTASPNFYKVCSTRQFSTSISSCSITRCAYGEKGSAVPPTPSSTLVLNNVESESLDLNTLDLSASNNYINYSDADINKVMILDQNKGKSGIYAPWGSEQII